MNYYGSYIPTWDVSSPPNIPPYSPKTFSEMLSIPCTGTVTHFITSFLKDMSQKRSDSEENLTLFLMRHSEEAFSKIWNEPEEDIWDKL
jgi:hypothetical protein